MSDFLEKLPKALSEEERRWLLDESVRAIGARGRALALIDALTALTAEQAAQIVLDGRRIDIDASTIAQLTSRAEAAEARVRELEAECRAHEQRWLAAEREGMAAEQKLADANALLGEWRGMYAGRLLPGTLAKATDAHLAGQPAAPTEAAEQKLADANALLEWLHKRGGLGVDVHERLEAHLAAQPAAPSRTEAEPVWDAINKRWTKVLPRTEAEQAVLDACAAAEFTWEGHLAEETSETAIGRAELARRGLK